MASSATRKQAAPESPAAGVSAPARSAGGLSPKQERFVAEYLIDLNASAAYRRAGYEATGNAAEVNGSRLLRNAQVRAAIDAARAKVSAKLEITAERVVAEAWQILVADPRELVEHHVGSCRHCWGRAFRYQRTASEVERDRARHEAAAEGMLQAKRKAFDEQGGGGFDARREPNPECPECFGAGIGRTRVNDTRRLSPAAAALYAGVKQTRDGGTEVRMHDKLAAAEKLMRHLGLYDAVKANTVATEALLASAQGSLPDQARALLAAGLRGDLTLTQTSQLLAGLGTLAKLIETTELEARVAALEGSRKP
ncbi:MAG TPA: terminase small subunit [Methylibium sp.]|uniref:terminase small subunit n=1 Tax=Methylibium sp. TaxID=2067992 RepID=UPI002DBAAB19|nr:terminase small subunit [Methylibium sp.]HEU4457777.1 terminase small subunit [Methylibium sp.]